MVIRDSATENGEIFDWIVSIIFYGYTSSDRFVYTKGMKLVPNKYVSILFSTSFMATVSIGVSGTVITIPILSLDKTFLS